MTVKVLIIVQDGSTAYPFLPFSSLSFCALSLFTSLKQSIPKQYIYSATLQNKISWFVESTELEGTHQYHQVQLLSLINPTISKEMEPSMSLALCWLNVC